MAPTPGRHVPALHPELVADYLLGENVYIVLSLVAKSLLAWQVFGGTLPG